MTEPLPPLSGTRVVLCDADGNLFPSEEPAFEASVEVTNRFLADHGVAHRYGSEELRLAATGRSYRTILAALAREHGVAEPTPAELEELVHAEREAVTAHLRTALHPDPAVLEPLTRLAERYGVAAVSSSADGRIEACFEVTGMAHFFPPERRFSAEDSLPVPTSKPDPAIYTYALHALHLRPEQAVAVEDSPTGATAAVAAGIPTVGNLQFVQAAERDERREQLTAVGVVALVGSWGELLALLG
ncbi:HAD family hydrolase [Microlunatus flavus]|uniref:Haloacid dehalogenase superfamily, subfamily IA, variant 3 with third motif having DD or ED n=1 Tax=Microlunatus flavus TaxID=1036181 RepID=A0A1H9KJF6_9ACTN|nr:HAD family phosphatase [Microlunatus flavus]SEQ99047.1 haloacid dehalogenase superfamily, subfamily IA, variant 3 with third motif having DD or ED [Microlunatus flavus]